MAHYNIGKYICPYIVCIKCPHNLKHSLSLSINHAVKLAYCSTINEKTSEKSLSKGAVALRKKHFEAGKVKNLVTTEDILFSSSSAAADFVTGYSVSGPANWRNASGVTLKEIESQSTK